MFQEFIICAKQKFAIDKRMVLLYVIIYFLLGIGMDAFGRAIELAKFTYWWQIITVYLIYTIPTSLLLRNLAFHTQYAYGLVAVIARVFGLLVRNFLCLSR